MKKFYYSKEASQDESLIGLPMEHRNTIDVNSEHRRGMSSRAASVNSLDLLSEVPTIPRVKTRDVTRSMSDVASRTQSNAQKCVTETELSSSWLYKTMQASINARFKSPRKSPLVQKRDLEQSILQDPELKPIPMKSKAAKTSSCICHFATMIAISLCTIGFLACIAVIIYMEIFADRSITSLHTPEAEVDLSDVVLDSREAYNLTTHKIEGEERILNEALTHKFDGDEEILNDALKSSSTNDLPSLLNKSKNHGLFTDFVTDASRPAASELKHVSVANTRIKFHDDATVIYEMKSEEATEVDVDSNFIPEFKGRSFGFGLHETDEDNFENKTEKSTDNVLKENSKQDVGVNMESEHKILSDSVLENTKVAVQDTQNFTLNENLLKNDLKDRVSVDDFKLQGTSENMKLGALENKGSIEHKFQDVTTPSEKLNTSEIFQSQDLEFEKGPNPVVTNDVFQSNDRISLPNEVKNYDDWKHIPEDSDAILTNLWVSQAQDVGSQSIVEVDDHPVKDEYDVSTMLVTIDDTEVTTDSYLSKRNEEIKLFQVSSPTPGSVEPIKQINGNSKKPIDIKVSLAEAMKHLQNLDANNKLTTSRTKPKQKVKNVQKPKRKTVSDKDERKHYLQRMRLMLIKQMQ